MKTFSLLRFLPLIIPLLLLSITLRGQRRSPWDRLLERPSTLNVDEGVRSFDLAEFDFEILNSSQTISKLAPKEDPTFDYTPADRMEHRDIDSCYHLGDINFRLRTDGDWVDYSTARKRKNIIPLEAGPNQLAVADLQPTLGEDLPVEVVRSWEEQNGLLTLRFTFLNTSEQEVEIGSLGIPLIFNNILSGKSLEEAHAENVFYDPYIGKDAGYLQVVRLHGEGSVLLVIPDASSGFEAYSPLNDDLTPRGITFEGFHEWMIHTKAHADNEWKEAQPWNEPSSRILEPGESAFYGIRFTLARSVKAIEDRLSELNRPVATGTPGYVLPKDVEGSLFIRHSESIRSLRVEPTEALVLTETESTTNGWKRYKVTGQQWGRARVTVTYDDDLVQTIHYKVISSEAETVRKLGEFLTQRQWFDDPDDPFQRGPSIMTYDYDHGKILTQDRRAWIVGVGDEGGSGSYLAAFMKQLILPNKEEIDKLSRFVDETLWGGIQYSEGPQQYGVRKSLFYYEPDSMPAGTYDSTVNYNTWAAWNREHAETTGRSYNYPHVTAAHWVMYRLARTRKDLVTNHPWLWYLENAFHTAQAMVEQAPHYAQFGQMEGTIFVMLLKDLKKEGFTEMATALEATMRKRADLWKSLAYPFGSEMPWDSTGQEEVYMWSKYFGYDEKAMVTLNAILAYMPTVPHWGYNGSARRYWDFWYAGKLSRLERQLHHYGSALNAIPVLNEYRENPTDLYLLRVGHAGMTGGITNVTKDGFGPAAFHSFPSTLKIDGISGDYGTGFFGYAINNSSYLLEDPTFGWLGFGGNVREEGAEITLEITSAARSRVFVAPTGLWINLNAGRMKEVRYDTETRDVSIVLEAGDEFTKTALLEIECPATDRCYQVGERLKQDPLGYRIELGERERVLKLQPAR